MILDRLGRALVAPKRALAEADEPASAGQAPTDLTLLIALVFLAANLALVVRAGFLIGVGEIGGGFSTLVARLAHDLQKPLIALVAGAVLVTLAAGKRRSLGRDSDLACIAFMPVAAVAAALVLVESIAGTLPSAARTAVAVVALAWYGAMLAMAVSVARRREP